LTGKVCLCLAADTIAADLRHLEGYRHFVDLAELRVDRLLPSERAGAIRFPGLAGLPVILTVRKPRDGGCFEGSEGERIALLERLSAGGFAWVDLEEDLHAPGLDAVIREASGLRVIRSLHDLEGVPDKLAERVARLARSRTEVPKAAVTPRSSEDLLSILGASRRLGGTENVILGMGDRGFPTRVLAPKLGSAWCYTSPGTQAVAPGQIDPRTLAELYHYRSIGARTAVFGVIGNPVMHSRSPLIHNRAYEALGIDAVYLPFLVSDLDQFWPVADELGVGGLSVTVPHKEAVLRFLDERDGNVEAAGACNTVTRCESRGSSRCWTGTNTDSAGFLAPLRRLLGESSLNGIGATVIGAGGAARGVVHGLLGAGARVLVLNRTAQRGATLARELGVEHGGLDAGGYARALDYGDLVVQSTSAGMGSEPVDPAPGLAFSGREIVYELVYAPAVTPFLARARAAGCRIVPGRSMLVAQAAEQFRIFTGQDYPAETASTVETEID
jgi:3-dehydroquinate dehydratase/shikimate dehydrogenase